MMFLSSRKFIIKDLFVKQKRTLKKDQHNKSGTEYFNEMKILAKPIDDIISSQRRRKQVSFTSFFREAVTSLSLFYVKW